MMFSDILSLSFPFSTAPLGWVHIQKLLLPLFDNVCEDSTNMAIIQLAQDFTLDSSNGDYMVCMHDM